MTYYDAPHVFTDDELKLATTIATQLAQAIEHKRDEEALRESEARLRATVEQATAGVARCDTNGRVVFANRTLCKMLGYTESELIGKSVADVTYRDDVKKNMRLFRRMIQLGKPFEIEKRYVRKDGSVLWADVSASAVREPKGKAQSTVAVIVDITARKKVEQALQKSNEALEQLVDQRTKALSVANAELKGEIERRKGLEGEILSVSDREQQRLGQELHDGLCQHLTAVAFMARSIAMRLKNHRVIDAADIEKIAQLVNDAASRYARPFPCPTSDGCRRRRAGHRVARFGGPGNLENTLPAAGQTVISNRRRHGRSAPLSHRARSSHQRKQACSSPGNCRQTGKLAAGNGFARNR